VIEIDDSLHVQQRQQQTLRRSEDKYLCIAPAGEIIVPKSILFEERTAKNSRF